MRILKEFFGDRVFSTKEELFKALKDNKQDIYAQKKLRVKHADAFCHTSIILDDKTNENKEVYTDVTDINKLKLELVINSTNVMDSHSDVHIKGIWNKSLKDNKEFYLLQEHKMTFDKIIGTAKGSVSNKDFKSIGKNLKGDTQLLIFKATIDKQRNPFMFEQYAKGYVKEHSVGMQYVKYSLAINSDDEYYEDEKKTYDKYIDSVANKEEVEEQGYFFAVTEAKILEGSAVVKGSNFATPTLNVEAVKQDTSTKTDEPSSDTQKIDYSYLLENLKKG